MYRSNAYIRNGRLYRGNDDKIAFSWRRFLVVSTMVAFLAAANLKMIGEVEDQDKDRFQSLSMLSLHSKPRLTNYGLFSLQQTHNSVIFRGAFVKAKCSYESWEVGDLCMEVGEDSAVAIDRDAEYQIGVVVVVVVTEDAMLKVWQRFCGDAVPQSRAQTDEIAVSSTLLFLSMPIPTHLLLL
mmetsp:Transcript_10603/g.29236  ORF Transcript_10603/g.29236 Transcript_10603/m.29236 type:complete len:183 (+) Transcript_10603:163-711(+)